MSYLFWIAAIVMGVDIGRKLLIHRSMEKVEALAVIVGCLLSIVIRK